MPNTVGKIMMLLVWAVVIANIWIDFPGPLDSWLGWIGALLVAAHLIECAVFSAKIRQHHAGELALGYGAVFLFGILHAGQWQE
ncbi:MAG TPA: DUF1145 domain-containing protein [Spongiibacteraceae bacterium]|jgi:uncharacterized protein YhhL (DUF1145 family)|nr:DUF1145 domain-containing protein [Spongiibacteraceae bacterium]HUH37848.1 DUF1145 domain-containing protein [Spongiibacteraceae bacterium]